MARQNIDEDWKTDPRRRALIKKLGSERLADGARVELNWLILDHRGMPVPLKKFKFVEDYEALIECGLATLIDDNVEIAGADRYSEWFDKQAKNGSKGGRPSKTQNNPDKPNETQNNPTKPKITQGFQNGHYENPKKPSSSSSSSFSFSVSSSNKELPPEGETASPRADLIAEFYESWRDRYHDRAPLLPADHKKLKSLGESLGLEPATTLVRKYLRMDDRWFLEKRHDVQTLMSNLAKVKAFDGKPLAVPRDGPRPIVHRSCEEVFAEQESQRDGPPMTDEQRKAKTAELRAAMSRIKSIPDGSKGA